MSLITLYCSRCDNVQRHEWKWVPVNQVRVKCTACLKRHTFQPSVELSRMLMEKSKCVSV